MQFGLSDFTQQRLMFQTTKNLNDYAVNFRLINIWSLNNRNSLYTSISYSENLFNEQSDFWSWSQNSNPVTMPEFTNVVTDSNFSKAKSLDLGIAYNYTSRHHIEFESGINFISNKFNYMEVPVYSYDKDKSLFNTT